MKLNKVGSIIFGIGTVFTLVTFSCMWLFFGMASWLILLLIEVSGEISYGGYKTIDKNKVKVDKEFSDHFIYYNLFDKNKRSK